MRNFYEELNMFPHSVWPLNLIYWPYKNRHKCNCLHENATVELNSSQWFRESSALPASCQPRTPGRVMRRLRGFHRSHWNHFPKYFLMSVIFSSHACPSYIWYLPDCLFLIEPRRPLTAIMPPLPPSLPTLRLFLRLIWCNYLIVPAFVTHWPCLAFLSCPRPSSPTQP